MEGRFEDYTLGRNISIERVKEIYHLFKKHQFQLAGLRSFGKYITDEDVLIKRSLADRLRNDPELFARTQKDSAEQLVKIPVMAKGVKSGGPDFKTWLWLAGVLGIASVIITRKNRNSLRKRHFA
jgi:hypothetical protein